MSRIAVLDFGASGFLVPHSRLRRVRRARGILFDGRAEAELEQRFGCRIRIIGRGKRFNG